LEWRQELTLTSHRPTDREPTPERRVEELAKRHRHLAVLAAHDVLGDWTLAEDAAQLAFVLILKRLRAGDDDLLDVNPEAAVRRNARWAAMKLRHRTLRRAEAEQLHGEGNAALGPDHCSRTEARLACEALLSRLPEHYRSAIGLRFFHDLSDADAAARLDVTLRTYRRRLDRAILAARSSARAIGLRGAAALLVTLGTMRGLLRRAREAAAHLGGDLTAAWTTPVVNATALAVLLSGTAGGAGLVAGATSAPPARTTEGAPGPVALRVPDSTGATARLTAPSPSIIRPTALPTATPHRASAWEETPEDSSIYSAAAAPRDSGGGRVVALGLGHACFCLVLFESADAGRSWRAAPGPALNVTFGSPQVTLPPAYPDDPRIFVGTPWDTAIPDTVAARFGGSFQPLSVSGYITIPPSFEQNGTILVTEMAAVVEVRLQPAFAGPLVFQPPMTGSLAIASPRVGEDMAYVVAQSVVPSRALDTSTAQPSPRTLLYRCASTICTALSTPPIAAVQQLALSPRFASDRTLALAGNHDVLLSRDGGASFTALPDPGAVVTAIDVAGDSQGPVVWATLVDAPSSRTGVARWDSTSGWVSVIPFQAESSWGGWVHPLLLDTAHVVVQTGDSLLCTADAGRTWAARCR
jgi:DNA-directed RNA polymerase specialized sigma24 family protein